MKTAEQLKSIVKEKYSQIAEQSKEENAAGCCGATPCCGPTDVLMADDYSQLPGYVADADLGLGCGLPTEFADIKEGNTVVDLGSGAGNDAFVARSVTGASGRVIGIDFTEKMIVKARENTQKLGYTNVEFLLGEIEHLPLANDTADVVVSNCVLNLVPNKAKAFEEMFRVLKPGGHFSVSDIVLNGKLPENIKEAAEMYAGCVSGAVQKNEYLDIALEAGFKGIVVQKSKTITIPDEILQRYLLNDELEAFKNSGGKIESITLYGVKPEKSSCCGPECCK